MPYLAQARFEIKSIISNYEVTSKIVAHIISGQKWYKNNHILNSISKVLYKSMTHIVNSL